MRIFPRTVLICTVLAMFGSLPVFGQNTFGLWTGVGVEKKISKGTNLDLEVQYLLTDYLKAQTDGVPEYLSANVFTGTLTNIQHKGSCGI